MTSKAQNQGEIERCVRCGNCMAVCPVYEVARLEGFVARGKISLVALKQRSGLRVERPFEKYLTACLMCNRCKSSCPNEVDTAAIVQAVRVDLAQSGKTGWFKKFILNRLLARRKLLPVLLRTGRISRPLWASRVPEESGLTLRFLGNLSGQKRSFPAIAKTFYLDREVPDRTVKEGLNVGMFIGCVNNYLRPHAAHAAVRVLQDANASVWVPREQACCGMPAFGAGALSGARALAKRNIRAFLSEEGMFPDVITSPCASCAYMLKTHLPELLAGDAEWEPKARLFAERVKPFSVLWAQLTGTTSEGPGREKSPLRTPITYHDPCHLSRGFSEQDAPRFLLTSLEKAQLVEMCHPCRCCGHGGMFNIAHYGLSTTIGLDKVRRAWATGARIIVTECSGCILQLLDMLKKQGLEGEVLSTAEAVLRFGPTKN
jgi:glycolate oxidase iron-sulfur subunit